MIIYYLLKKGFQYFPPCLSQVLTLNDLGIKLIVFHGENTKKIDELFRSRSIEHYTIKTDKQSKNKFESAQNFMLFKLEMLKIERSIPSNALLWFGNAETVISLSPSTLKKRKFVMSVLELYELKSYIGKKIGDIIQYSKLVICCEKHRAQIMRSRYNLKYTPIVVPNKPYDIHQDIKLPANIDTILKKYKDKYIIIYQGIIRKDRPLENIALALSQINNPNIVFFVLGQCDDNYKKKITSIYNNTVCLGFVPAPQHLLVTSICNIGIANYDLGSLNNIFCAPNKIYEYAKYGLPLIISENLGLTETVGAFEAAECVNFSSIQSIKKGIERISQNFEEYSRNAMAFYDNCDLKQLYNDIIKRLV